MDISIYSQQYSSMALSYCSNWAPFHPPEYSPAAAAAIDDPELQALLNADCYLVDPTDYSLLPPPDFNFPNFAINGAANWENEQESSIFPNFTNCKRQKLLHPSPPPPAALPNFDAAELFQDHSAPPPPLPDFAAAERELEGIIIPSLFQDYYSPSPPQPQQPNFAAAGLSAQSAAARQRRRRITAKTQELGKLVPGGQKMNTAEMLQSAYKYIKFLQAQVSLLEFLPASPFDGEEVFQKLLESSVIQEKLYSTEKCLAPKKLVEKLNAKSTSD